MNTTCKKKPLRVSLLILWSIVFSSFVYGNPKPYDSYWKEIDQLIEKQLPKSALPLLDEVYAKAEQEKNQPQQLKTITYRFKIFNQTEENPLITSIEYANAQFDKMSQPAKAILHSILAQLYQDYYQENRYQFFERTSVTENQETDIRLWDLNKLQQTIEKHFLLSLEETTIQQNTTAQYFDAIYSNKDAVNYELQPSLFDVLTQRVIAYYLEQDAGIHAVSEPIKINQTVAWQPINKFISENLPETNDPRMKALRLLQNVMQFNYAKNQVQTYTYNDLKRLSLVKEMLRNEDGTSERYLLALQKLQTETSAYPVSGEVAVERAQYLVDQQETNSTNEYYLENKSKALKICEDIIKRFPETRGAVRCANLKESIEKPSIALEIQEVELPNTPIPALLSYRNVTSPTFRIVKIDGKEFQQIKGWNGDKRREELLKKNPLYEWSIELPFENDYSNHATIINLPKLENGMYYMLASCSPEFSKKNNQIVDVVFQISELGLILNSEPNGTRFYVLNRSTGKPISDVEATIMTSNYDYKTRKYVEEKKARFVSSKEGDFFVDKSFGNSQRYYVNLANGSDTLYSDTYFRVNNEKTNPTRNDRTWFFTDRAIYRPGQTIYFKGISLYTYGKEYKISEKQKTKITLLDGNWQEIGSVDLITNEYGSFEGQFVLPTSLLNGNVILKNENASIYLSVEEYKRPTFEITIDESKSEYKIGSLLNIQGAAHAYAGFPLDEVSYSYKVTRSVSFPFWRWWLGFYPLHNENIQIAYGEGITNEKGEFDFDFKLIPDAAYSEKSSPLFTYTIQVNVTDKQGETRSATQNVVAGYQALSIKTTITENEQTIEKNQLKNFRINVSNLQQQVVKTEITRRFYQLEQSKKPQRESLFSTTIDRQYLSDESLRDFFPLDNFYKEKDPSKRAKKLVYEDKITVDGTTSLFPESFSNFGQGEYYVEIAAKDAFGKEVKTTETFVYFDQISKKNPVEALCWTYFSDNKAKHGQTVKLSLGSAAKNAHAILQVRKGDTIRFADKIVLNDDVHHLSYTIKETDKGIVNLQAVLMLHNRIYSINNPVEIAHNKELSIEVITSRNVLNPGETEKWEIRLKNAENLPVKAELLAAMYDASLDVFAKNTWNFSPIRTEFSATSWLSDVGFQTKFSRVLSYTEKDPIAVKALITPIFDIQSYYHYSGRTMTMKESAPIASGNGSVVEESTDMLEIPITEQLMVALEPPEPEPEISTLRTNFDETAFFYPQLVSTEDGKVNISFTIPDALTRWKLMLLAHSKNLEFGYKEQEFTTSKPLMIMANIPRFVYEEDTLWIAANVINTGKETINGMANLELFDALTMEPIAVVVDAQEKVFSNLDPGRNTVVKWKFVPAKNTNLMALRFSAKTANFTDSEQKLLPILSNKVQITQTMPMLVGGESTKDFTFTSLKNASIDRETQSVTLNISTNPVWYAIQALPYLAQGKEQNADQLFYTFYSNTLASYIANKLPQLMTYIESWKQDSPEALLSQLQKDENLKAILLNETPWVLEAKSEQQQKEQIALLFNINKMRYEQKNSLDKIEQKQKASGAWAWFDGMPESHYITRTIVTGFGQLKLQGVIEKQFTPEMNQQIDRITKQAVSFIEKEIVANYEKLNTSKKRDDYKITPTDVYDLYALSFFASTTTDKLLETALTFYKQKINAGWNKLGIGQQAMAALVLHRSGMQQQSKEIIASLRERAIFNSDLGMYWNQKSGYYWYESPIENQSLLISAFDEIANEKNDIDMMRMWLLTQKQTTVWQTTRATAEAIYALVLRGSDWTSSTKIATVKIGQEFINMKTAEAGTGFVKKQWNGTEITPDMSQIEIYNPNNHLMWGGLFHQYFIPIDKVKKSDAPLSVRKEIYVEKNDGKKAVLIPVGEQMLKVGDEVVVQLLVETTHDMDFVFMKDLRAATLEPVDQLSGYEFRNGVGYYQTMSDVSTEYFFDHLPKGKYTFQYRMRVNQSGSFSNGHAIIQCLYAPEFSNNSKAERIKVK
ncbi:MAG: hypothetical protein LBM67_03435 [Lentimicrobiaceae bacterium]|jgi:uncharacterized protein YfaS (alpha-2-macroglobulin family)|nr:hypothetical protein [Lentimicrobiaceae bacterium]